MGGGGLRGHGSCLKQQFQPSGRNFQSKHHHHPPPTGAQRRDAPPLCEGSKLADTPPFSSTAPPILFYKSLKTQQDKKPSNSNTNLIILQQLIVYCHIYTHCLRINPPPPTQTSTPEMAGVNAQQASCSACSQVCGGNQSAHSCA